MTPAVVAREAAGLTIEQAARRLRVGSQYLRQIERRGVDCFHTAQRLARIYGCEVERFLYVGRSDATTKAAGRRPKRPAAKPAKSRGGSAL